jgi:hemolysin D
MTTAATTRQAPLPHPVLGLLRRYCAVLRAAWAARAELAGPQRLADERAFLPAALALQETPPHPAPRRAAIAICALFVIAVAWSWLGQVDVVAVAPGRLVIHGHSKIIQPLEAAVVTAIHVRDGDNVAAGQLLIELDPTAPQADAVSVAEQRAHAQAELNRAEALLRESVAIEPGAAHEQAPGERAGPADHQLEAERQDLQARLARLDADTRRREAEQATASALHAKLQATLPLAVQRERDIQGLSNQGFIAQHAGQDRTRERVEQERDLATAQARLAEAQASIAEAQHARAAYLAELRRTLQERATKARLELAQLGQSGRKAEQRSRLTKLTAPVAGTVQQLAVHTAGGVVTPAQAMMVIVPSDAPLVAEVQIDNKDIGFVQPGQTAQIKLETFNFTRYGTLAATVQWVAADAVAAGQRDDGPGAPLQTGNSAQAGQAVFPAQLQLHQSHLYIDGKRVRLGAGLTVSAEIKTGKRQIVDYLLSPIRMRAHESLREQ